MARSLKRPCVYINKYPPDEGECMALKPFSREDLDRLFNSRIEASSPCTEEYRRELKEYKRAAFTRIYETLKLIRKHYTVSGGRILEIGPFPFFFTLSMLELGDDQVTGISIPDGLWPGEPHQAQRHETVIKAGDKQHPFSFWTLNVEKDEFPLEDRSFDMVLCTEVLEHLIQDPSFMLSQINRVLKPGGILILTTPNGLYWRYLYKLAFFGNWEAYSPFGVYGRHNRLWALSEIKDLLAGNNFEIVYEQCAYAQDKRIQGLYCEKFSLTGLIQRVLQFCCSLLMFVPIRFIKKKDGDQLYVAGRKSGPSRRYQPGYLYSIFKPSYNLEK
jgi:SAM-dependent methyltransferase